MAKKLHKKRFDSQEFIAWNEDVMPSSSTQPPRKVIKREPGDFEIIWIPECDEAAAAENLENEDPLDVQNIFENVENEDPMDVQNILEPIHLEGNTQNGRWKCPYCPYVTKAKGNVTKHIKTKHLGNHFIL